MKILGILMVIICFIANVVIGTVLFTRDGSVESENENMAGGEVSDNPLPYRDTESGITLTYPAGWTIATTDDAKMDDSTLVDVFSSQDESDDYLEGFFVYEDGANGESLVRIVDSARNNLATNGLTVLTEEEVVVGGNSSHRFITTMLDEDDWEIKGMIYVVLAKDRVYHVEFYDQESTFEETSKAFEETVASIKFI